MLNKKINTQILYSILVLSIAICWGMSYIFIPWAQMAGGTSAFICMIRFGVSAILIGAIFNKKIKIRKENILPGLMCGVILFAGFLLNVMSQQYTTPSNAAFFTSLNVVIFPILAAFLLKKYKTPISVYICAVVSVVGILVISMGGADGGMKLTFELGDILALGSAIVYSFHFLFISKAVEKMDNVSLTFYMFAVGSVLFGAYYLIFEMPTHPVTEIHWFPFNDESGVFSSGFLISILGLTLLCSFYTYLIQTKAQSVMNPTKVSLIISSESAFGAMFSILFGLEKFKWTTIVGGLLILGAVFYTGWATRPKKTTSRPENVSPETETTSADTEVLPPEKNSLDC